MGFFEAIGSVFNNYFSFSGRALRSEYWYFMLFSWLVFIMATILDETVFYSSNIDIYGPVDLAATVVLFIPSLSVASRRLHDSGKSGWWQLIWLTVIGIPFLLYWLIRKGDPSKNRFGMPPYGSKSDNSSASRAAREIPSDPSTNSEPDSNPSAERQSEPTPAPSRPQSSERAQSSPRASSSASTPSAKPKDLYFDNRRKPNKSETSEAPSKPSTPEKPKENNSSPKSSSDDDVFFDNRRKKE
tara:strand:+ start:5 stop:733 length:729 start_codon:yes stop_codon:yes gene_type:complete